MHEQKRFLIAVAMAIFGFGPTASAQKDAAEKTREGGVEHWIEYYRTQQRERPPQPPPESIDRTSPRERPETEATPREETQSKQ